MRIFVQSEFLSFDGSYIKCTLLHIEWFWNYSCSLSSNENLREKEKEEAERLFSIFL
jgi:hypothetical protein